MALGAMTVVAVSILTAVTLLPALIAMLGDRVLPGGIVAKVLGDLPPPRRAPRPRGLLGALDDPRHGPAVGRRDRRLRRAARPWRSRCSRSRPARRRSSSSPRTATCGSATNLPPSSSAAAPTRCRSSPPSTSAGPSHGERAAIAGFARTIDSTPGVSAVAPPAFAGDSVLIQATPSAPSESDATIALVERLRDSVVPATALRQRRQRRRRRRNRAQPGRPRPGQRLDVEDHPLRPGAQLPGADGDAALAAAAAEGGADEPALDRGGLRRPRRDLPVGLVRQPARLREPGRARHDQRAADLRHRLRPLDGLRGLPDVADPRALPRARRQRTRRRRRALDQRPHDLLGGADHDLGLRRLRAHRRALDQGARPRLRGGDRARRDAGAADPRAGGDEAARRLELVDALLARPGAARPQLRERHAPSPSRRAEAGPNTPVAP